MGWRASSDAIASGRIFRSAEAAARRRARCPAPAFAAAMSGPMVAQLGEHAAKVERDDLDGCRRHQAARAALEQRDAGPASRSRSAVLTPAASALNSRATAGMLRFSARLAMTARRRPFRIDANSVSTSVVARCRRARRAGRAPLRTRLDALRAQAHPRAVGIGATPPARRSNSSGECAFELRDRLVYGRADAVQPIGGAGDAAGCGDRGERAKMAQVDAERVARRAVSDRASRPVGGFRQGGRRSGRGHSGSIREGRRGSDGGSE